MATTTHHASAALLSFSIYSLKEKRTKLCLVLLDLEVHKHHHLVLCLFLSKSAFSLLFKKVSVKTMCGASSISTLGSKVQIDAGFDLCLFCSKVGPHQLHVCRASGSLCSPKTYPESICPALCCRTGTIPMKAQNHEHLSIYIYCQQMCLLICSAQITDLPADVCHTSLLDPKHAPALGMSCPKLAHR